MMTQGQSREEIFLENLERIYNEYVEGDSLQRFRVKAWDHFQELGLPEKKDEPYRYIKLRELFSKNIVASFPTERKEQDIAPFIFKECESSCIVFINGFFRQELSKLDGIHDQVVISPLSRATRTYGTFLNSHFARTLKEETDPFAALNAAMHKDGVFIYVPPGIQSRTPIQILHVIDTEEFPMLVTPRLQIFLSTQAEAEFHVSYASLSGKDYIINGVMDFALENNAHTKISLSSFNLDESVWHLDAIRAHLKRDSKFTSYTVNNCKGVVRQDYRVTLASENSECAIDGVAFLDEKAEGHVHVLVDHQTMNCRSRQLFKNVLKDFSKSSFEGKILVRETADGTDAFQLNNNLLLSERAHADSKPNLEIFAADVKASHGATIGRLDEEELFYLESRGLSKDQSKNILIGAFLKEVVEMIPLESLRSLLSNQADNYI